MPGPEGYGPAGKWVHDRAHRIMAEGNVPKHVAYAIATQQGHKVGKTPKDFKTSKGVREAKQKYDAPKSAYQKTAMLAAFFDEVEQIEKEAGKIKNFLGGLALTGALAGGGTKAVSNIAAHKAPTAITQAVGHAAPTTLGVGGLGGRSVSANQVREFMP